MTRSIKLGILVAVAAVATVAHGPSARAQSDCGAQVRDRAMRVIFDVSQALAQRTALPEDEYTELRGAIADWDALTGSHELVACAERTPGFTRWWNGWVRRYADAPVHQARARIAALCAPQVRSYLRRQIETTEAALARAELARARALASETEIQLRSRDLFRTCPGTRDEVAHELDVTIPAIYDRVALPTVLRQLATTYRGARQPWDAAVADLRGPADSVVAASVLLASPEGRAALRRNLDACTHAGAMARQLGATDATAVPEAGASMSEVEDWCRTTAGDNASVLARVADRVKTRDRIERERWERYQIDGWGMRKVYQALGRPDRVSRRNGRTEWLYGGATCTTYVFGAHGRELSRSTRPCPSDRLTVAK